MILVTLALAGLLFAAVTATAGAQALPVCNGPGALQGTFSIDPNSGPAGSSAVVSGTLTAPTLSQQVPTLVLVYWLETGWADAHQLTGLTADSNGHFSGMVTVPAGAAPGLHEVGLWDTGVAARERIAQNPACLAFTVAASVQQSAYPAATVTSLPSTGLMLLVPAGGLAAGGLGGMLLRLRRRG